MNRSTTLCSRAGAIGIALFLMMLGVLGILPVTMSAQVNSFPYTESFESGNGAWTTGGGTYAMWQRNSGSTSSSSTGPSSAYDGSYYFYIETSSPAYGGETDYLTASFNFTTLSNPVVRFAYHMYGSTMGTLEVEVTSNGGSSWTSVWSKSGDQGDVWYQDYVVLTGLGNNANCGIRFKGTSGSNYYSDAAVDYIEVFQGGAMSYTSSAVLQPNTAAVQAGMTNAEIIRYKVTTSGLTNPLTVSALKFKLTGTTSAADVTAARIFYTGNSTTFSASNQFGSDVMPASTSTEYTVSGTQSLVNGDNYFWLVYDLSGAATLGNVVDGEGTGVTIGATTYTPNPGNPAGNRQFKGPLSGVYTIDPNGSGPSNYTAFQYAAADLALLGIAGPVTFNVASATFNEQFEIPEIAGSSAVNTITFDGGVNNPVIQYNTMDDYDYVIRLDRADYITFRGLTINNNGDYGGGIILMTNTSYSNPCDHITIDNCTINMSPTATDSYTAGITGRTTTSTTSYYNYAENLLVQNCTINGGGSGISLRAYSSSSSSYWAQGNRFINNTIQDFYIYGIYLYYYHSNPQIIGNTVIQRNTDTYTSGYGIYVYRCQNGPQIENNRVIAKYMGIYYYYVNYYSASAVRGRIVNNMINVVPATPTSANSYMYGLYLYYSRHLDILHNSINIIPPNNATNTQRAMYLDYGSTTYTQDWNIRNNLVQIDKAADGSAGGTPYLFYNDDDYPFTTFDNNVFFTYNTSPDKFYYDGTDYDWSTLPKSTFNANSIWGEAYYVSPTDLHSRSHAAFQAGANLGVPTDYDGQPRGASPCIGADEYPTPPDEYDMSVAEVLLPYADNKWARIEGAASHTVKVLLENVGLKDDPQNIDVVYKVGSAPADVTDGVAQNFTPAWDENHRAVVEFATPLSGLAPDPALTVYARTFLTNEENPANDIGMDTQEIHIEKVHGFEDFEDFQAPTFSYEPGYLDTEWQIIDNNGGDAPAVDGLTLWGAQGLVRWPGDPADEWIVSPAALLTPEASYRVGFDIYNLGDPLTIELAWGESPDPGVMTTFATFSDVTSGIYTAQQLWQMAGQAGSPYFNTPFSAGPYFVGIRIVSSSPNGFYILDNIKFDDNPSPPPKIGYALPGTPIDQFIDTPTVPIVVTANYKSPGLIHKTFQVATTTNIYGVNGDFLWDVETSTSWITLTKQTPEPTAQGYNFTPPRPRQFQTFTLTVDPSGLAPGTHVGNLTLYGILFNDDFMPPNDGLIATNEPFVVPVELRITNAGGKTGPKYFEETIPGPLTVAGSPYPFTDPATGTPIATLNVTGGQIDQMTIRVYPNQLPQNLARMLYVLRYWQVDHVGSGWTANLTLPYTDQETAMILDPYQLRGVRQPAPLMRWENPIFGTTSVSDPANNQVTVNNLNEYSIVGNIALAHPYGYFGKQDGGVPAQFGLAQNYPNPFNPTTSVEFAVREERHVRIAVYNRLGAEVAVLVDETVPAGSYVADFDATGLASGSYLCRMTAGDFVKTITMTLSK